MLAVHDARVSRTYMGAQHRPMEYMFHTDSTLCKTICLSCGFCGQVVLASAAAIFDDLLGPTSRPGMICCFQPTGLE